MAEDAGLLERLEKESRELLDLTSRNRLINTSRSAARSSRIEIVDERSEETYRRLVVERKAMAFAPSAKQRSSLADTTTPAEDSDSCDAGQFGIESDSEKLGDDTASNAARFTDAKLQTDLSSDVLQKRLLKLYYDSRTYEEEQGANILFLALGFLKWFEDEKSNKERFAPLLLVPVSLDRKSAGAGFKLNYTDEDIGTNLSIQERLKADFGIRFPTIPEGEDFSAEEFSLSGYFDAVANSVRHQLRWQVLPNDIVLWFFSFSKLLMHRDLKPTSWPDGRRLDNHRIVRSLLQGGYGGDPPLFGPDEKIDERIPSLEMVHILDADSSQAVVIEEAKRGRDLVIQGPPGTGKSQTITNIIAAAVKSGKSVLFAAEKMAALDVVKNRLANIGLGDMCLELHSHKANKRIVLDDLERTFRLGQPRQPKIDDLCGDLDECRGQLNQYLRNIHSPLSPSGLAPYEIIGQLVRLRASGTAPPEFELDGALQWSHADFRSRRRMLEKLVDRLKQVGTPAENAWRGVEIEVVLPTARARIIESMPGLSLRLDRLTKSGEQLAAALRLPAPADLLQTWNLYNLAWHFLKAPKMDRQCIVRSVWKERRGQIDELLTTGSQFSQLQAALKGIIADPAWDEDASVARRDLARYGRTWLRFFSRKYRNAQRVLRDVLANDPPVDVNESVAILDQLLTWQKAKSSLTTGALPALGIEAFGTEWNGLNSNWELLVAIALWEAKCRDARLDSRFREMLAGVGDLSGIRTLIKQTGEDCKSALADLKKLFESLRLNTKCAFGQTDIPRIRLAEIADRLQQWQHDPEGLSHWTHYDDCRREVASAGLTALVEQVQRGGLTAADVIGRFEMAYYEALIRQAFRQHRELSSFQGVSHERIIDRFKLLDKQRIDLARGEVALSHYHRLQPAQSTGSALGEVAVIRQEIQKKRRHLPIRKLLVKAGHAVQAIKPVFMMSPLSIAQFLEPGVVEFDLLLIDEASQVQPVDALGAIARAKQIVVVGDSKQLPPTSFFDRMMDDDDSDEEDEDEPRARNIESILGLCCAQGLPSRMLDWHYRSRHHSLIAVSNHEFYDNRLFIVRSPGPPAKDAGLLFHYVANGVYDRGGSATNRIEAREVAQAVIAHAKEFPNRTLGVGAFSVKQRDAILDELEILRRANPSLEHFFARGGAEPFFVKNLENIQGDERDVIFISVGFGKDANGYVAHNFGPLQTDGGERRLNVLITRAKECCRVFSTMRADDIDLVRARSMGARALRSYLKYAESGLLDTGTPTGGDYDSEFELQVAKALASRGIETHPQVGVAGFFIDLAVVDKDHPGRYLLGIECDGAQYHQSRSARDRDRLREHVLCARGWLIHRIWSTDWFQRPDEQLRKALESIEDARSTWRHRDNGEEPSHAKATAEAANPIGIDRHVSVDHPHGPASSVPVEPYRVASVRIPARLVGLDIHEVPTDDLAQIIAAIVQDEGPIHAEEIARRVTDLWGFRRTGRRITDSVIRALRIAARDCPLESEGDFFVAPGLTDPPIRNRSGTPLQNPETIPPSEIRKAVQAVVTANVGVAAAELIGEVVQLFGFNRTGTRLREVIDREIRAMLAARILDERNEKLYVSQLERDKVSQAPRAQPSSN